MVRGNLAIDWHPIQEEVVIFLVASYKGKQDKLWLGGALGASTELTNLTWPYFMGEKLRIILARNNYSATKTVPFY